MKTLDCSGVEPLLDLYAAGECDSGDKREIRAHLTRCPACQEKLEEVRALLGLLELHYRAEGALDRLKKRIEAEARPRHVIRFRPKVRLFAAAAALLLLTLGLGRWLPRTSAPTGSPFRLGAELALVDPAALVKRDQHEAMKGVLPSRGGGKRPALALVLRNPEPYPLVVDLGRADVVLDLSGPGVRREAASAPTPAKSDPRTIPPGGKRSLPLERLTSRSGGRVEYLHPTRSGEYTLSARARVPAWPEGRPKEVRNLLLKAGPVKLPLQAER
jgi:hypothetical protein